MLRDAAYGALARVGHPELGEWQYWTGKACHVRRRLSPGEAEQVGEVRDVRGTAEATRRLNAVQRWLPAGWTEEI